MEDLAPPLKLLIEVKYAIENGESIRIGLNNFLFQTNDEFSHQVAQWVAWIDQNKDISTLIQKIKSPYRQQLLEILQQGLSGKPILTTLKNFEELLIEQCQSEINLHIGSLPYKLLVPLLFFQFPAFLILLLGPILSEFLKNFGH